MTESVSDTTAARLGEIAAHFDYPPTPDIASHERRRLSASQPVAVRPARLRPARLIAGAFAAVVLLLAAALLVPQTRAALLEIFDIGAIRILADEEPTTPAPAAGREILDLAGATTLEEAANLVDFEIRLPAGLGQPDEVYVQQLETPGVAGQALVLVWLDPERPGEARLSLYEIDVPFYGIKQASLEIVRETRVNGQPAFWVEGPHRLQLQDGGYRDWFFVPGNVLIWTDGQMTYRLESGLPMAEAIRIAESME